MAIGSSILAKKIPWTEEPDGLQSMGSQTVGHNWETENAGINYEHRDKNPQQHTGKLNQAIHLKGHITL